MKKEDLVIGEQYEATENGGSYFEGDILKYIYDDGSPCPKFYNESRKETSYAHEHYLKPYKQNKMKAMKKEDLVLGEKYVATESGGDYRKGDILKHTHNDGTDYPQFYNENKGIHVYAFIDRLKPYKMRDMKFRVHSPEHSKAIQEQLFKLGVRFCSGDNETPLYADASVLHVKNKIVSHGNSWSVNSYESCEETTLDDLYKLNQPPKPRELKLNNEYTAIITDDKVKVGCQEFTHEVINELHKAINQ